MWRERIRKGSFESGSQHAKSGRRYVKDVSQHAKKSGVRQNGLAEAWLAALF